jgi:Nucleoside 2-deoxyribosyltransferase like
MDPDEVQVFLGGACGKTTWRNEIAIPMLEAAGVTYYNPQLGVGEWTPAREAIEIEAKDAAGVLMFVINGKTRGVASIGEAAYYLGIGRRLALVVNDVGDEIDGQPAGPLERDDLNRGRIFLRSMAREQGVPIFTNVEDAVRHALELLRANQTPLNVGRLRALLGEIRFRGGDFLVEEIEGGFLVQLRCLEMDAATGAHQTYYSRKWHIAKTATESDVVRTAFKAAVTWQEHEAREAFTYRGVPVFGPHGNVEDLLRLYRRGK